MRRPSPWSSRPTLLGTAAGILAAIAARLAPAAAPGGVAGWALPLALILLGCLSGVLAASRQRRIREARVALEMQEELRFSQDHIMTIETFRSLAAYLEIAAHQMKEPMQALSTDLRALAADNGLTDASKRRALEAQAALDRLQATLRHLSVFTLGHPGRAPFSVNVLLRESVLLCRQRAAEKKIAFEERYAVVPPVMGSAKRVQQALFNVLVNAVESMPFGGGTILVETGWDKERITVRVRDTGIGIRPDHLPHIFEPFFTTKPEKNGAGLGLWAARQMLDIIGADIAVRSVPLQGTEVVMSFPQAAPLRPGREGTTHPPELKKNTADDRDLQIA